MRIHRTSHSGFSLLELLVSIAIMGVVTTLGVSAFSKMTTQWLETKTMTELENNVETVFESVGKDLADTLSAEVSGHSIVGEDREWINPKEHNPFEYKDDRMVIPVQGVKDGVDIAVAVQYAIVRNAETTSLKRSTAPLGSDKWLNPLDLIAGVDTLSFDIEYATDNVESPWVKAWTASTLPKAVRVGIVVADRDNAYYQVSRKAVYTIAVQ